MDYTDDVLASAVTTVVVFRGVGWLAVALAVPAPVPRFPFVAPTTPVRIKKLQAEQLQQRKDYDTYLANLDVE